MEYIEENTECHLDVATEVIQMLTQADESIAVGESLTGGGLMAALTSVPGASQVFRGGIVAYTAALKEFLLGVDGGLIASVGVIDGEVAKQMAKGACTKTTVGDNAPTTWGIGTTGVAGPEQQDGKPVGTVFIGIASPDETYFLGPFHFTGSREQIREATIAKALWELRQKLAQRAGVRGDRN